MSLNVPFPKNLHISLWFCSLTHLSEQHLYFPYFVFGSSKGELVDMFVHLSPQQTWVFLRVYCSFQVKQHLSKCIPWKYAFHVTFFYQTSLQYYLGLLRTFRFMVGQHTNIVHFCMKRTIEDNNFAICVKIFPC